VYFGSMVGEQGVCSWTECECDGDAQGDEGTEAVAEVGSVGAETERRGSRIAEGPSTSTVGGTNATSPCQRG